MKEQNSKAKKNKINFIIPDFLNVEECTYLLSTFSSHKEIFKENINILGFVGQFPGCAWNKRNKKFDMYKLKIELINEIKNIYNNEHKTSLFIKFDDENIENLDLEDKYSNDILKIFNNKKNYVICESERLKNYIKEKYTDINIIDEYDKNSSLSNYLIVNPNNNKDGKFLEKISNSKVIIIPDGGVIPERKNFFKHLGKESIMFKINPKKYKYYEKNGLNSFDKILQNENYLTFENLIEYAEKGIDTFIFSGLGVYNLAMYENYIEYIYKDEYKLDAINNVLGKLIKLKEQECIAIHNYEL